MPRRVTILGSTGSIGCNTVDLLLRNPDQYDVVALTAGRNVETLIEQARALRPQRAVIADDSRYVELKDGLAGTGVEAASGQEAVVEAAQMDAEWVMAAIVGAAGLRPALAAVDRGAILALANKECLVCAGALMTARMAEKGATLLPVDSEHNAIYQVFDFDRPASISRIILTASGGPFRQRERVSLAAVTPQEAVAHPNWSMGAKISVDSATMMNKGLELIEAYHIFPVDEPQIDILVHPQSVIHSMVEYDDGSVLAELGTPDMRTPIAYTLGWPERVAAPVKRLDLAEIGKLTFEAPDTERFPALRLAREALKAGGGAATVLNAANEIAVRAFLDKQVGFLEITDIVERALDHFAGVPVASLDDVFALDEEARAFASNIATPAKAGAVG